jgi:hypothetical protein
MQTLNATALVIALLAAPLVACERDKGTVGEAIEEVQDEIEDAADEVRDEVDDAT